MKKFLKRLGHQSKVKSDKDSDTLTDAGSKCLIPFGYDVKEKDLPKLHKAVWTNDYEAVKRLVMKEPMIPDKENRTPLHLACVKGEVKIVQCLLEFNAKVNLLDHNNQTPLIKAIEGGYADCVDLLLNYRADLTTRDFLGNSPIHIAVKYGHTNIVELLLKSGVGINSHNREGMTPVHFAVEKQDVVMLSYLCNKGAELNCVTNERKSALMLANEIGDAEIVDLLVNFGANKTLEDNNGHTAEQIAKLNNHIDCYKLLINSTDSSLVDSGLRRGPSYQEREINDSTKITPSRSFPEALREAIGEETGDDVLDIESDVTTETVYNEQDTDQHFDLELTLANKRGADIHSPINIKIDQLDGDEECHSIDLPPPTVFREGMTDNSIMVIDSESKNVIQPVAIPRFKPKSSAVIRAGDHHSLPSSKSLEPRGSVIEMVNKIEHDDETEDSWKSDNTESDERNKQKIDFMAAFALKKKAKDIKEVVLDEMNDKKELKLMNTDEGKEEENSWRSDNSDAKADENQETFKMKGSLITIALAQQKIRTSFVVQNKLTKQVEISPGTMNSLVAANQILPENGSPWDSDISDVDEMDQLNADSFIGTSTPPKNLVEISPNSVNIPFENLSGLKSVKSDGAHTNATKGTLNVGPESDWDSSNESEVIDIPVVGDIYAKDFLDVPIISDIVIPPSTSSNIEDAIDTPVNKLTQAEVFEFNSDEEVDIEQIGDDDDNENPLLAAVERMTSIKKLPHLPIHIDSTSHVLEDDFDMGGLSPIVEQSEDDGFSIASEKEELKVPVVTHHSIFLSPETPHSAEPIYVNAEWFKQPQSETESTGAALSYMPQEQTLFQSQTVALDTERIQNVTPPEAEEVEHNISIQAFNATDLHPLSTHSTRAPWNIDKDSKKQNSSSVGSLPRNQLYPEAEENEEVQQILSSSWKHYKDKEQQNLSNDHANSTGDFNLEERLLQALRALEREHRARQEAEVELDEVRQHLLAASFLGNNNKDGTTDNSGISPRDDSEISTQLHLLQLRLNEEQDHRQSLEAVYDIVKKQLLDKEEELFKSQSACQDLEMAVQRETFRFNSSQAEHERLKDQMHDEICALRDRLPTAFGSIEGKHDMSRRNSTISIDSPVLSRTLHVPDGEPKSLTTAGVQTSKSNSLCGKKDEIQKHITMLRAQLNSEKSQLQQHTSEIIEEIKVILTMNLQLNSKLSNRIGSMPLNRGNARQLAIEIERLRETNQHLENITNKKIQAYEKKIYEQRAQLDESSRLKTECDQLKIENDVTRSDLKTFIEKYAAAEQKIMELEEQLAVERKSLENIKSSLSGANLTCGKKLETVRQLEIREEALSSWLSFLHNNLSVVEESNLAVHARLSEIFQNPDSSKNIRHQITASKLLTPVDLAQISEILSIIYSTQNAARNNLLELRSSGLLADCDANFQLKKLALLQSFKLPVLPDLSLSVEQFLIDRLMVVTKMEQEAVTKAEERKEEIKTLQHQLDTLNLNLEQSMSQNNGRLNQQRCLENNVEDDANDLERDVPMQRSVDVHNSVPDQILRPIRNTAPPPIGSFENIFARLGGHVEMENSSPILLHPTNPTSDGNKLSRRISWANFDPNKSTEQCQTCSGRKDSTENQNNMATLQDANNLLNSYQITIKTLKNENSLLCQELSVNKHHQNNDQFSRSACECACRTGLAGYEAHGTRYSSPQADCGQSYPSFQNRSTNNLFGNGYATHHMPQNDSEERQKLQQKVTELELERGRMLAEKQMLEENAKTEHRLADKLLHRIDTLGLHQQPLSLQPHSRRVSYGSHSLRQHRRENRANRSAQKRPDSIDFVTSSSSSDECDTQRFSKPFKNQARRPYRSHDRTYNDRSSKKSDGKNRYILSDCNDDSDDEETIVVPINMKSKRQPQQDGSSESIALKHRQLAATTDHLPPHDRIKLTSSDLLPKRIIACNLPTFTSTTSMLLHKAKLSLQSVEKDLSSHGPPPSASSPDYLQYLKRKYLI